MCRENGKVPLFFPVSQILDFLKIFVGEIQEVGGNVAPGKEQKLWKLL